MLIIKVVNSQIVHVESVDYHIEQLCKVPIKKLHALSRVPKFMDITKKKTS